MYTLNNMAFVVTQTKGSVNTIHKLFALPQNKFSTFCLICANSMALFSQKLSLCCMLGQHRMPCVSWGDTAVIKMAPY